MDTPGSAAFTSPGNGANVAVLPSNDIGGAAVCRLSPDRFRGDRWRGWSEQALWDFFGGVGAVRPYPDN